MSVFEIIGVIALSLVGVVAAGYLILWRFIPWLFDWLGAGPQ